MLRALREVLLKGYRRSPLYFKGSIYMDVFLNIVCILLATVKGHYPNKILPMLIESKYQSPEIYFSVTIKILESFIAFYISTLLHSYVLSTIISFSNSLPFALSYFSSIIYVSCEFIGPFTLAFPTVCNWNKIGCSYILCHYIGIIGLFLHLLFFLILVIFTNPLHFLITREFKMKYVFCICSFVSFIIAFILYSISLLLICNLFSKLI